MEGSSWKLAQTVNLIHDFPFVRLWNGRKLEILLAELEKYNQAKEIGPDAPAVKRLEKAGMFTRSGKGLNVT